MTRVHVAAEGESVESIAYQYGHFWETVWNAPENASLRALRKEPNILVPGDAVTVPALREKSVAVATTRVHTFRRRGVPSVLRVQLLAANRPRAGLAFTVTAGAMTRTGTTDAAGWVVCYLMPDVTRGELRLDATGERFTFQVGTVGPPETRRGQQTRLRNLGYGREGMAFEDCMRAFQRSQRLPETGEADEATIAALQAAHGS